MFFQCNLFEFLTNTGVYLWDYAFLKQKIWTFFKVCFYQKKIFYHRKLCRKFHSILRYPHGLILHKGAPSRRERFLYYQVQWNSAVYNTVPLHFTKGVKISKRYFLILLKSGEQSAVYRRSPCL